MYGRSGGTMKIFLASLMSAAALLSSAHADELKTAPGQPFCLQMDQLQEYLIAAVKHDERWMKELDCYAIVGGAKVTIIEEYPSESDIGHVVKVRIFSPKSQGSVVGYTLSLGIK
jgi:hypothetical protein